MKKMRAGIVISLAGAFFAAMAFFYGCANNAGSGFTFPGGDTNTFTIGSPMQSRTSVDGASRVSTGKFSAPTLPSSDGQLAPHAPYQVIVKFSAATAQAIASSVQATVVRTFAIQDNRYATLQIPRNNSIVQTVEKLKTNPSVIYAEPNWYRFYKAVTLPGSGSGYAKYQWAPQAVSAPQVWTQSGLNHSVGDPSIVIGIADTGVNGAHQDLIGNVQAGFDYADNYTGSEGAGTTICPQGSPYSGGGCTIPASVNSDQVGHGTLVASTADANGNTGNIAGICWTCTIEPIKLFGSNGTFTTVDLEVQALVDAANSSGTVGSPCGSCRLPYKPEVVNMSFGGPFFSNIEDDGINYALQHGIVLVSAAGNSANTELDFPASYPGVIAVGAVNANNQVAPFSTQGAFLALSAPGVQMYGASNTASNAYQIADGTSFSSPMVSGSIGLIDSVLKDNGGNPPLSPDQAANLLEQSANKSVLNGGSFSNAYGYGILNVLNSVSNDTTFKSTTGGVQVTVDVGGSPACDWDVLLENGSGQAIADTLTGDSSIPGASGSGSPPYGQPGLAYAGVAAFYLVPAGSYTLVIEPPAYGSAGGQTCGTNSSLKGKEMVSVSVAVGSTATSCSSPSGPASVTPSPCTVNF